MSQADPSEVSRMTGRLAEQGMISGLSNVMRSNAMHSEVAFGISWIFLNPAAPNKGCAILLERDVPCFMLGMLDLVAPVKQDNGEHSVAHRQHCRREWRRGGATLELGGL
jgi:hypothetical protein